MAKKENTKKTLIKDDQHQHLTAQEILETILQEGNKLSSIAKEAINNARDVCWSEFKKEHEKTMNKPG